MFVLHPQLLSNSLVQHQGVLTLVPVQSIFLIAMSKKILANTHWDVRDIKLLPTKICPSNSTILIQKAYQSANANFNNLGQHVRRKEVTFCF